MTDKPTNFITRHVTSLRDLAGPLADASPGLAEMLNKSANIIEQVVDGNATIRADHERQLTELRTQIHALEAQLTATHQRVSELSGGALAQFDNEGKLRLLAINDQLVYPEGT